MWMMLTLPLLWYGTAVGFLMMSWARVSAFSIFMLSLLFMMITYLLEWLMLKDNISAEWTWASESLLIMAFAGFIAILIFKGFSILRSTRSSHAHLNPVEAADAVIQLGVNMHTGREVILSDRDANLHTLAIGTTGSGKTTAIGNIVESALERGAPLIYVDGKGDRVLCEKIAACAKQFGSPFYLFSMTDGDLRYNPIASGGFTSQKDRIVELRVWSEDHYRKVAESYLQTVLKALQYFEITTDLYSLAKYMNPNELYALAREKKDARLKGKLDNLEKMYPSISSLVAEIENLAESEIGHRFDCSTGEVLTLEKALAENACVVFSLQPLAFPAYAVTLGKLVINDIKSLMASQLNLRQKKTTFAIFDEFSVFAGDQVINLINQGREAGMCAVLATQSLSDIARRGGQSLVGQILNNCNNYIIQRQNNPEDAKILSNIIGSTESTDQSITLSEEGVLRQSIRHTRAAMVHEDDIKRLKQGEAYVVNKRVFQMQKVAIRQGVI